MTRHLAAVTILSLIFLATDPARAEEGNASALAADPSGMPGGALGAADDDPVKWEHEGLENASISMRCASFGL